MIKGKGITALFDEAKILKHVYKNDLITHSLEPVSKSFSGFFSLENPYESDDFFNKLDSENSVISYEIKCGFSNHFLPYLFSGIKLDEGYFVIVSDNNSYLFHLYNELLIINNEHVNKIRSLTKEINALKNNDREVIQLNEITRLNNDLINTQRELAKKNSELNELIAYKNRLIGMAAHDLRNPIAVILGFSDLMLEGDRSNLTEDNILFLQNIYKSSQSMLTLINDLLVFSSFESGKVNLKLTKSNLSELLTENLNLNRIISGKKNIELILEKPDEDVYLSIDKDKIVQVLNNLIGNAIKFSFPNSSIEIQLKTNKDYAVFSVSDKGIGIPPQNMDNLFKPFSKISSTGTSGEKGTGLGLNIVKNIVEAHKGKVWVESRQGKGTTFFVSLPLISINLKQKT
ncbi:MAG: HAMP domain-containing sensor histidine kinase [Ignavibacteria bacterium]